MKMMMFVHKAGCSAGGTIYKARGCYRRFTWELKIGEAREGNRQGFGRSTAELRKTKI
jgi:hypothetical protein